MLELHLGSSASDAKSYFRQFIYFGKLVDIYRVPRSSGLRRTTFVSIMVEPDAFLSRLGGYLSKVAMEELLKLR